MTYSNKISNLTFLLLATLGIISCGPVEVDYTGPTGHWPSYGGTDHAERYSPITQITPENVGQLEVAWEYHTGDISDGRGEIPSTTAFEATPILVRETLYCPTPFNRIIALNPETGEEKWTYDPKIDLSGFYANQLICRGVSYWYDMNFVKGPSPERIFMGTNDSRLIAVDAQTGIPCKEFGDNGEVNLLQGVGDILYTGEYQVTSPPAIYRDLVIVGSAVADNVRLDAPSGVVRAFSARSGDLVWSWDLSPPQDSVQVDSMAENQFMLGTPNVWAPMAVDSERGLLYVPTGNPSPDYYGGLRNNIDYYASSIVALNAKTGEVVWNFQTVHHDLWDFDVPAQPTLTDIEKDGKRIPAVIQATKMGLFFILNRETGEPIFPIEERPVPQTDVPGEYTSPTQPYPVKPLPLVRHDLTKDEIWGPLGMNGNCLEKFENAFFEGAYTPPRVGQPTIMYPGNAGGSNWGGVAVDKEKQILVANVMDLPWLVTLISREDYERFVKKNPGISAILNSDGNEMKEFLEAMKKEGAEIARQTGTPYAMVRQPFLSNLGLPCSAPPWGKIAAIDLKSGDYLWQEPFGTVRDLAPVPLKVKYGVPNLGGPLITGSGLIFIAATVDNYIRAFDIQTGEEVWEERLPAGGQATPMTYRIGETGKQYIVLAVGGHGRAGTKLGDSIIAYALP